MDVHGGKIDGPFTVDRDLAVLAMVVGHATVLPGCTLLLRGIVTGDLIVEAGARATVRGLVYGTVVNNGGGVEIHGTVGAVVDTAPASRTVISHDATIKGLA